MSRLGSAVPRGGTGAENAPIAEKALKLVAAESRRSPREFLLNSGRITIGSAPGNDVVLADDSVSRAHARVRWAFGNFLLEDAGSTNGTFLNGERVTGAVVLKAGDRVEFGRPRFSVVAVGPGGRRWARHLKIGAGFAAAAGAIYLAVVFVNNWTLMEDTAEGPAHSNRIAQLHPSSSSPSSARALAAAAPAKPIAQPVTPSAAPEAARSLAMKSAALTSKASAVARSGAKGADSYPGIGSLEDYLKPPPPPPSIPRPAAPNPVLIKHVPAAIPSGAVTLAEMNTPWTDAQVAASSDHSKALLALNTYRSAEQLSAVVEDSTLSEAAGEHGQYLARNYGERGRNLRAVGADMHDEHEGSPGYTPEGKTAAHRSNVAMEQFPKPPDAQWSVDGWIAEPFHRLSLLNPHLSRIGYGQSCDPATHFCGSVLNALDGSDWKEVAPEQLAHPVQYPAPNPPLHQLAMVNHEWPNPLTSCPGYELPVGVPITLQLGRNTEAKLSSYTVTRDGVVLDACGFDSASYTNPVPYDQEHGRTTLRRYGAVILVPRKPYDAGPRYEISARVNGKEYKWSFSTAPDATTPFRYLVTPGRPATAAR